MLYRRQQVYKDETLFKKIGEKDDLKDQSIQLTCKKAE